MKWLGATGKVEWIVEHGSTGNNAYFGAFKTPTYPEIQKKRAELYPTSDSFVDLSNGYFLVERYQECIAAAHRAIALNPDYAEAYNNICTAENVLEHYDEAMKAGWQAVRLQPNNALMVNNLNWAIQHSHKRFEWADGTVPAF